MISRLSHYEIGELISCSIYNDDDNITIAIAIVIYKSEALDYNKME